ncbi:MAG: hypothetical protein AAGD35_02385 [Actinomycetota bacterium]
MIKFSNKLLAKLAAVLMLLTLSMAPMAIDAAPAEASAGRSCLRPRNFENHWYHKLEMKVPCQRINGSLATGTVWIRDIGVDDDGFIGKAGQDGINRGVWTAGCRWGTPYNAWREDRDAGYWLIFYSCKNEHGTRTQSTLRFRAENRNGRLVRKCIEPTQYESWCVD